MTLDELKDEYKAQIAAENALEELKAETSAGAAGYSKGVEAIDRVLNFIAEQRAETAQEIVQIDPDAIDDGGELL